MKKLYTILILLCSSVIFCHCHHADEPNKSEVSVSGITETGSSGPYNFIGNIDFSDWDPSSYSHLTINKNYWIDIAPTDTLSIGSSLRIHNLLSTSMSIQIQISSKFTCTANNISLSTSETKALGVGLDSVAIGTDTVANGTITIIFSSSEQLNYAIHWNKPKQGHGGVVHVASPTINCLYPAYPNPAEGSITIAYSINTAGLVQMFVLNDKLQTIDTIINSYQVAGSHAYTWLTTTQQRAKYSSGIYRICLQAGSYKCSGDILLQ
jgi:hypothetical protein